jgi:branched-chain amino acid transport system substrate-binding protein
MRSTARWALLLIAAALLAVVGVGCGSSDDNSSSSSATTGSNAADTSSSAPPAADLGTPNKAKGEPLVFGMLNIESGPVTFPEARQAAETAVKYVNDYKGGIGGRPIKLVTCATDGQPSTSARCANQILDQKPVAILGAADTGAPGAFEVYKRANLAYVGGVPFTPAESNSPDAIQFISISVADNAAAATYSVKELGVKKAAVIYTDDSQGKFTGLGVIANVYKSLGVDVKTIPVAPNAADFSSAAAQAISSSPDLVYINAPAGCPAILKALKSVGSTAKIAGIDPCTSPPALKAAGDAAEGLYFAQPFDSVDSGTDDANLLGAVLAKYGPKDLALDTIAIAGFASVINVQAKLDKLPADQLTKDGILKAFKDGSDNPNFLAHPYTCDGKQLAGNASVCNAFQKIKQVKGGKVVTASDDWVSGADNYKPVAP